MLVDQNPQIPDRTAHLLGDGADPSVALLATCKILESGDVDAIAIPCNTAHAFVPHIQAYLGVPIVNMLEVTVRQIRERWPQASRIGLLATIGTVRSRLYADALARAGLTQVLPGADMQDRVMNAIYGPRGVKAGYGAGECVEDVRAALHDLVERGQADAVILGCTELPLVLPFREYLGAGNRLVPLVDPTDLLAAECVRLAMMGIAR